MGDGCPGVGQHLHKGTVDVKDHRQHAAGYPRQDRAGTDQDAAQQVPQPADANMMIPVSSQRRSSIEPVVEQHDSSFAQRLQSDTAPSFEKIPGSDSI